jgi:hypothetical protein
MHDDDEERFPRITLWQFLKATLLIPLAVLEFVFGYGAIAAFALEDRSRKKPPAGPRAERAWPQVPDRID